MSQVGLTPDSSELGDPTLKELLNSAPDLLSLKGKILGHTNLLGGDSAAPQTGVHADNSNGWKSE